MQEHHVKSDALELIRNIDRGNVAFELSKKLAEVVRAVSETGKRGSVSITLDIEPMPKFGSAATAIKPKINANLPAPTLKQTVKFARPDGTLSGDDPNQSTFSEIEKSFSRNDDL